MSREDRSTLALALVVGLGALVAVTFLQARVDKLERRLKKLRKAFEAREDDEA